MPDAPRKKIWQPSDMITDQRVDSLARSLFPDDFHEGDCMNESGREGLPCSVCAERNALWLERKDKTKRAMFRAFGFPASRR